MACTSPRFLESITAVMLPDQQSFFEAERKSLADKAIDTVQQIHLTYKALRRATAMDPAGRANAMLKQRVKEECQQLTTDEDRELLRKRQA